MRWLLLVMFALSSTALAQPVPRGQPAQPAPRGQSAQPAPDKAEDRREKIKQRVRALRAYTLTEELQLDEQTAAKLFPALQKYDDEFDKLLQARVDIQRRLDGAGSLKDPKAVDKLIDEAVANQRALWDTEEKRLAQLRKILTPAQTARVLIVLPAMERKIQNQLRQAVQRKAAPRGEVGDPFERGQRGPHVDPFERGQRGPHVDPFARGQRGPHVDPFAGRGDATDPFDDDVLPEERRPAPKRQRKAGEPPRRDRATVCDPFNAVTGCK